MSMGIVVKVRPAPPRKQLNLNLRGTAGRRCPTQFPNSIFKQGSPNGEQGHANG